MHLQGFQQRQIVVYEQQRFHGTYDGKRSVYNVPGSASAWAEIDPPWLSITRCSTASDNPALRASMDPNGSKREERSSGRMEEEGSRNVSTLPSSVRTIFTGRLDPSSYPAETFSRSCDSTPRRLPASARTQTDDGSSISTWILRSSSSGSTKDAASWTKRRSGTDSSAAVPSRPYSDKSQSIRSSVRISRLAIASRR